MLKVSEKAKFYYFQQNRIIDFRVSVYLFSMNPTNVTFNLGFVFV